MASMDGRAGRLLLIAATWLGGMAGCGDETESTHATTTSSGTATGTASSGGGGAATTTSEQGGSGGQAPVLAPALYPSDRTHSPITPYVVTRLAEVLAVNPTSAHDLFMKVGDSITASGAFLFCFAGDNVDLDTHTELQPTLDLYRGASVLGTTPFDRDSNSVLSGRTAYWAMTGDPCPLVQEMDAVNPAVGEVMLGTNDIGWYGADHLSTLDWYHGYMFDLVDAMLARGIIPVLSTIPPRDDDASHDAWVPTFNATIRAFAQGRQIPLVDFHRELAELPSHGLSGDGVHPNASGSGACVLDAAGLQFGYNVRNLITLEALDRVRRAALGGEGALDAEAPTLAGEGTLASPFVVQGRPFVDVRDTSSAPSDALDVYDGCSATADESGPEVIYRLETASAVRIRAIVLDRGDVDVDIHLLGAEVATSGCLDRSDALVEADLDAGTHHLVVDTYVDTGTERSGEYVLVLMICEPGDPACIT